MSPARIRILFWVRTFIIALVGALYIGYAYLNFFVSAFSGEWCHTTLGCDSANFFYQEMERIWVVIFLVAIIEFLSLVTRRSWARTLGVLLAVAFVLLEVTEVTLTGVFFSPTSLIILLPIIGTVLLFVPKVVGEWKKG